MTLRWLAITCDAQRLLTKSQMWGKLWHATVQAGGWVGVRSGREKHLPGKTPQTAPPSQDLNVVNAATKVDPRAMAEPGSRYPEGDGPPQAHIFHMLSPPVFDRATALCAASVSSWGGTVRNTRVLFLFFRNVYLLLDKTPHRRTS